MTAAAGLTPVAVDPLAPPAVDVRPEGEAPPGMTAPATRRRPGGWDILGITLTAFLMLGVQQAATAAIGTPLGRSGSFRDATIVAGATSFVLFAWLAIRDRPRLRELPRWLCAVWADPPGDWVAAPLGALLAIPLLGLYTPVLLGDSDSSRIIAAVSFVRAHGIGFLEKTQDNFLPHLVLGPVVALGGLAGVKLVSVLSVLVLAAVTCYVTRRITGSMLGAAAGSVALMAIPSVIERGNYVPMYPAMLALGYLGSWLAYRAITEPDRRWLRAAAAGVCIALAPEAQPLGLLFLAAPVLLGVFAPSGRKGLASVGRIYLMVLVASLPRIAVNLSVGGLDRIVSYRTDYWITKGYVREIQSNFWNYSGIDEPLDEYLGRLPLRFVHALGGRGWVVLAAAGVAWLLCCRGRARWFVMAVVTMMALALTVRQVPPFPRYYSPLWPGIAILVGVGVAALARRRAWPLKVVAGAASVALVVLAATTINDVVVSQNTIRSMVDAGPYHELAALVDDGKGVIGARSHTLLYVTSDIPTWGGQFLSEAEYVTYLSWPSDAAVVDVMDRHDIGWALVHANRLLETTYHDTWLLPHHGVTARAVDELARSPLFCRYREASGFVLYRLGTCAHGR